MKVDSSNCLTYTHFSSSKTLQTNVFQPRFRKSGLLWACVRLTVWTLGTSLAMHNSDGNMWSSTSSK